MADVTKEIVLEVGLKDSTAQGTTSAKTRLRELQKALVEMSLAGQDGTKAFREMEAEAGKLKDQIGDTQQRIKQLASDTRTIDTFVSAVQGITAGFQIAQGAAALFGDENEDLQKAMLKVQGAMALANGVQQVANLLNKDSVLITNAQAAAQSLYATAVGVSTGAMRAFRIALLATGIGAAVAAIGLLIAKWDELTAAVRRFLDLPDPKQRAAEQAQALQQQEIQLNRYRNAYEEHTDKLIAAEKRREEQRKKVAEAERQRLQKLRDDNKAFIAFMEETNLLLYEEELDSQARKERSLEAAMQREGAIRKAQANNELEGQKKRLEDEKFIQDQKVKLASDGFNAIGELATAFAGSSEESQKRAFNINKAAGIAQTLIDTFAAAQGAYKSQMTVPDPSAPIRASVAAGIAIAQGLARVAAISKTQFKSTSTGTPPPTPAGTSSSTPAPTFTNPQTTNLGTGELSAGQGQGSQPMRAYVVERDIQQTTSRVRRLSEFATLG